MKVIFLDVDGVLNCDTTTETINGWCFVDDDKIKLVRYIMNKTGAKVVLDSTWRQGFYAKTLRDPDDTSDWGESEFDALVERCAKYGVWFYGYTKWPESGDRGDEIFSWINDYCEQFGETQPLKQFVIIDDLDLGIFERFYGYFVKTSGNKGLTLSDAEVAIDILNGL